MIRQQNWYDLNESRPWPFDDRATLIGTNGQRLPNDLIADLYLRFPIALGDRAFVSSLTIGPGIVTVTFLGTGTTFTPMASVSLPQPVEPHIHYPLESLYPGVGGWIVFGTGIAESRVRSFRFNSALDSLLLAQTARRYTNLPVQSVGKVFSEPILSGLIRLQGGSDIETRKEEREIEGVLRDVAVIRLRDKQTDGTDTRNLLELYAGVCGRRPESRNCGDPDPIEFINTVSPDCCGNIFVEFRGCATISGIHNECGVIVNCGFGLSDACVTTDRLPNEDGRLPNEYDDQCADHSDSIVVDDDPGPTREYTFATNSFEDSLLPYEENFNDFSADDFTIHAGDFIIAAGGNGRGGVVSVTDDPSGPGSIVTFDEPPANIIPLEFTITGNSVSGYNTTHTVTEVLSTTQVVTDVPYTADGTGGIWDEVAEEATGQSGVVWESQQDRENIALWDQGIPIGGPWESVWKRIEGVVAIKTGATGTRDNAGLIINYRDSQTVVGEKDFWLVEIDLNEFKTFSVIHRRGNTWQIRDVIEIPELVENHRYKIEVEILPLDEEGGSTAAWVEARLTALDDEFTHTIGPIALPNFYPANGYFGFYSNRSLSWFEYLRVEDFSP